MNSSSPSSSRCESDRSTDSNSVLRRQFRAPQQDGQLLAVPELSSLSTMVTANRHLWSSEGVSLGGMSLLQFRSLARRELVNVANQIAADWDLPPRSLSNLAGPVIMTGHQPVLTHPGVWVKNIAAAAAAAKLSGTGVNLIVDNDQSHPLELAVPTGSIGHVRMEHVPLDDEQPALPWEERHLHNRAALDRGGETCRELVKPWGWEPLAASYWGTLRETPGFSVVQLLSRARIVQEARWGGSNLEVPISRLSGTDSFGLFTLQLISAASQFHKLYNQAITDYRRENNVTNAGQPVPFLAGERDRYELPFWLWQEGDRQRQPLFVVRSNDVWQLQAADISLGTVPADSAIGVEQLSLLRAALGNWKLRPRALTTTLFARLGLADLFIHGIGGAKYDEMADQLMQEFWGLPAPAFLTLTATLRLPVEVPAISEDDLRALKRQLRDLHFNPGRQLHLPEDHPYWERKAELIAEQQRVSASRGLNRRERRARRPQNRQRYRAFADLAASLAPQVAERERLLRREIERTSSLLAAKQQLLSREVPAVLHPEERLVTLFEEVRRQIG